MFHLIVIKNDAMFLRPKLNAFLQRETVPAVVVTPRGSQRVTSFETIAAALPGRGAWQWPDRIADPWFVHAGHDQGDTRVPPPDAVFACEPVPEAYEERCRYLVTHFAWVLAPWFFTFHEACFAFFTAQPSTAERFVACSADTRVVTYPDFGPCRLDMIVAHYAAIACLEDALQGAIFMDDAFEGHFAWRLAQRERHRPLLICRMDETSGVWWQRYTQSWDILAQREQRTSYGQQERYVIYRATHQRSYKAIWRRAGRDEAIARYTISGRAEPHLVFPYVDSTPSLLDELKQMATQAGWAYCHCYGGGSDEYHAVFWAQNPAVTLEVYDMVREAETTHQYVRRLGRF